MTDSFNNYLFYCIFNFFLIFLIIKSLITATNTYTTSLLEVAS